MSHSRLEEEARNFWTLARRARGDLLQGRTLEALELLDDFERIASYSAAPVIVSRCSEIHSELNEKRFTREPFMDDLEIETYAPAVEPACVS